MKKQLTAIFILSMSLLAGCSTNPQDINSTTSKPEHITQDIINSEDIVVAKIDADVIYPEAKNIPVVTTKRYAFTDEDIIRIADGLFDNSEYSTAKTIDTVTYTKDISTDLIIELEAKIEDLENLYNNNKIDANYYSWEMFDCHYLVDAVNGCTDNVSEDVLNSTPKFIDIDYQWPSNGVNEDNEYTSDGYNTATFHGCGIDGTYNDIPCKLLFRGEHSVQFDLYDMGKFVWKKYLYDNVSIGDVNYDDFASNNSNIENDCVYSIEDATTLCNDLLEKLGISNMAPMDICNLSVIAYNTSPTGYQYGKPLETGYCGYKLYYGKSINSISYNLTTLITGDANPSLYKEADINSIYGEECIVFTVMDSGIISMDYKHPTTIEDITSTDVTILDIDSILSFADIYLSEAYEDRSASSPPINISRIQLGLARSSDNLDADTFTLIPVWDFYYDDSYNPIITINAIDGSKIDRYSGLTVE